MGERAQASVRCARDWSETKNQEPRTKNQESHAQSRCHGGPCAKRVAHDRARLDAVLVHEPDDIGGLIRTGAWHKAHADGA